VFRNTGNQVRKLSNGKQEPRISEVSINDEVYLAGQRQVASLQPEPVAQQAPPLVPTQSTRPTVSAGQTFKDCVDCPEMVVIPAGSFEMGSKDRDSDEKPVRRVNINGFAMGKTEVTQRQWRALMGSNPSRFSGCGPDCPVEQVSWNDAQDYVRKLSQQTGKTYRLPSEAEWEYACRAGGSQTYCGSDDVSAAGWYESNSGSKTNAVAGKQANAFGV